MAISPVDIGTMFANDDGSSSDDNDSEMEMDLASPSKRLPDMMFSSEDDDSDDYGDDQAMSLRQTMHDKMSEAREAAMIYNNHVARLTKAKRRKHKHSPRRRKKLFKEEPTVADAMAEDKIKVAQAITDKRSAQLRDETMVRRAQRNLRDAQDNAMLSRTKNSAIDDVTIAKENAARQKTKIRDEIATDKQESIKHAKREQNQAALEQSATQDEIAAKSAKTQAEMKVTDAHRKAEVAKLESQTKRLEAEQRFHEDLINEARRSVSAAINKAEKDCSESDSSSESEDMGDDMLLNSMTMKRPTYDSDGESVNSEVLEYEALLNNFETLSDVSNLSDLSDMSDGALAREEQHLTELLRELDTYEKKSQQPLQ